MQNQQNAENSVSKGLNSAQNSAKLTNYTQKRYVAYAIIALIALALPFVRINGSHFFLLSFDHKRLDLLFVSFDTQELYLMPLVLIGLFLTIFFVTTLAGRIWCAWACPQSIFRVIFRDLIQTKLLKIHASTKNKQKIPAKQGFKKILSVCLFYGISLVAVSNLLWYFVPPEDFFAYLQSPREHTLLLGILLVASVLFTLGICFLQENFCVYVCPYARVQSVMFDTNTLQVIYDEGRGGRVFEGATKLHKKPPVGECVGCEACVAVCPTHIDIRRGMQLECINCLECADACSAVQGRLGRTSLISWSSFEAIKTRQKPKYLRFRTIAYCAALLLVIAALGAMSSQKERMLLDINRDSQLYKLVDGRVQNNYRFLFENTDKKAHSYAFEARVADTNATLRIVRPTKPVLVGAGAKQFQVVILEADGEFLKNLENGNLDTAGVSSVATENLGENSALNSVGNVSNSALNSNLNGAEKMLENADKKDISLPLIIRAYSVDEPQIEIFRESKFIYPK